MSRNRAPVLACFAICLSLTVASTAWAAPKADPWERWTATDPASAATIDHSAWGRFLGRHLRTAPDGINRVTYGEVDAQDHRLLKDYIAGLAELRISDYSRREQFAYWINLYNAVTVDLVLDHYPVATIRDIGISPGGFSKGPWRGKLVRVEGEALSLDDIEHRILRPIWKDPRIHFAINCASLGCPNLLGAAFTAENMEDMLGEATRGYVNHPRGAQLAGGKLYLSTLFRWYGADFGDEAAIVRFVRRHAEPALAATIGGIGRFSDGGYDWALNDCVMAGSQSICNVSAFR
jgi:hypothetical protein